MPYELGKKPICMPPCLTTLFNKSYWSDVKLQKMNHLQVCYDEMSGFQSCDSLMSQLPLRVFHLKHIFRTAVSVNVHFKVRMHRGKCFAFNAFYILF